MSAQAIINQPGEPDGVLRDPGDRPAEWDAADYLARAWDSLKTEQAFADMLLPAIDGAHDHGEVWCSASATLALWMMADTTNGREAALEYASAMKRVWSAIEKRLEGMR